MWPLAVNTSLGVGWKGWCNLGTKYGYCRGISTLSPIRMMTVEHLTVSVERWEEVLSASKNTWSHRGHWGPAAREMPGSSLTAIRHQSARDRRDSVRRSDFPSSRLSPTTDCKMQGAVQEGE